MDDFRRFEELGWRTVPEAYDRSFQSLTSQAAPALLDAVGAGPRARVLDVCSGPGYVAAAARERGADVTGVDFSAEMVALASAHNAGIGFREGDAEALPFEDGSFDAVVMSFGLLHLARPERALAEAQRVLAPGGRVGFTVWAPPTRAVAFGMVLHAIETHGRSDVDLPPGPDFFRFSDAGECRRSLEEAGFVEVETRDVPQTWVLEDAEELFVAMADGTVRTRGLLRAQTEEALGAIRRELRARVGEYRAPSGYELPMPAMLASARRP